MEVFLPPKQQPKEVLQTQRDRLTVQRATEGYIHLYIWANCSANKTWLELVLISTVTEVCAHFTPVERKLLIVCEAVRVCDVGRRWRDPLSVSELLARLSLIKPRLFWYMSVLERLRSGLFIVFITSMATVCLMFVMQAVSRCFRQMLKTNV